MLVETRHWHVSVRGQTVETRRWCVSPLKNKAITGRPPRSPSPQKKMSIRQNISSIRATLPAGVDLLCVSKYHPIEAIQEAYAASERMFGESRVQELLQKREALPKDIRWHFIGHLQTNKIRPLLPFVDLIHGIDSWRLLEAIDKEAAKLQLDHPVRVLLEVKVAQEATKYGFTAEELRTTALSSPHGEKFQHVEIVGIMGMASNTQDTTQIAQEFSTLHNLFEQLKPAIPTLQILSMGMSEDYPIAIANGSTLIRIGSGIFGERE